MNYTKEEVAKINNQMRKRELQMWMNANNVIWKIVGRGRRERKRNPMLAMMVKLGAVIDERQFKSE